MQFPFMNHYIGNRDSQAEICGQHASDAEKAGDRDAAQFFNQVREQNQKLIQ
jgi:hypothetical protein